LIGGGQTALNLYIVTVGALEANCYILGCDKTQKGVIIDPGADALTIKEVLDKSGINAEYIILTHGHTDHIGALFEIKQKTGAIVAMHSDDAEMLGDSGKNLSLYTGEMIKLPPADMILKGNETLTVGSLTLDILHTPGHTPGGISIKTDGSVFTGDTLFLGSIGRTDFPGGSFKTLIDSIKQKLLTLTDDTKVYPGHGSETTIKHEKLYNPFL
jgi:hydroxyacylglutathione hydrolase